MSLNIKNNEAHKLALELAALTGESMATAVTEAVRERLDRVREQQGRTSLSDRLLAIGKDCAAHLKEPFLSVDHGALLYGDDGLPR
jgi:antitoxin VapB